MINLLMGALLLGKSIFYIGDKLVTTILKIMHQTKESTIVLSVACKQLSDLVYCG